MPTAPTEPTPQKLVFTGSFDDGVLRIEYENYFVSLHGKRLNLTRAEFLILCQLFQKPERIILYEDLWNSAWSGQRQLNQESLKVQIYKLRRILEPVGVMIENLVNVGYRLVLPERKSEW